MRWLRTPAVQFAAIGATLFVFERTPCAASVDRAPTVVTAARLAQL